MRRMRPQAIIVKVCIVRILTPQDKVHTVCRVEQGAGTNEKEVSIKRVGFVFLWSYFEFKINKKTK